MLTSLTITSAATYVVWDTVAPITQLVLLTSVFSVVYDKVLFSDSDFGAFGLANSLGLAILAMKVVF